MKKKMGIRALAAILAASVVMSASTGMVSAKGASVSATGDVSDTSSASETTSRAAAKNIPDTVSVEGAALNNTKVPTGLTGAGTAQNPYQIGSLRDLLLMNSYINYELSSAKYFILTKDIDLSKATSADFTESDGILSLVSAKPSLSGNSNVRFNVNGNGFKMYGMNVTLPKDMTTGAIFGYINSNSAVENLTVESCTLRISGDTDGAYAILAVQNCGVIRDCTAKNCLLDARSAVMRSQGSRNTVSGLPATRDVYIGHAIGVADNAGKVLNFTAIGTDTSKGIFVKGARRYIGVVAGHNRKDITGASASGVRVLCFGSDDADTSINGKGEVAAYVGGIVGKNDKSATVSSATVTLGSTAMLFGDPVGGIAGENAGTIADSSVTGTNATGVSVTNTTANLYGYGRFGAIAGTSSGYIKGCGAYEVGFCFARNNGNNAYGGIAGANSGAIADCAASGSVNLQSALSSGVGGLIGCVQSGTTLLNNYAIVSASTQGANVGALIGKDGTTTYIGQNNYWSSTSTGLATPVPGAGEGQNDLTAATSAIVLTRNYSGTAFGASALAWSWQGSKASADADFNAPFSVSNHAIHLEKSGRSITLSCTDEGETGNLFYTVSISVPAGVSGKKLSAMVSVPVYVTASSASGAGASDKNPVVISSAQQMQMLQDAPDAHYKLGADITLGSDWTPVDFTGSLDGNGHTLRIEKPLFASVSGSRGGSASADDWKDSKANLSSGYIHDLTIVPTTCVYGGVFGDVQNATLRDVTYTVADTDDGFVALTRAKSGALIDTLSGSVYLCRCTVSVPIAVTAGDASGIGAMVGFAAVTNLVAEECATSSLMSLEKNLSNVGGLFGNIASVGGKAELADCTATGCVYVTSAVSEMNAKIMIGAAASGVTASGCTYAAAAGVAGGSVATEAAPFKSGITQLNPQSEEAKQSAEEARSMLELIDPEKIDEAPEVGIPQDGNGVYLLSTAQDVLDMVTLIEGTAASRSATFELQNDIDMNGAAVKMATTYQKQFTGTFRSASGHKYTLSNFTVAGTSSTNYQSATALFCYASGATFRDFALEDVTVTNKGMGTAVLVGYADKNGTSGNATNAAGNSNKTGADTQCTFTNIDITDCNVYSLKSATGTTYGIAYAAQAGTLIGAVWSGLSGNVYTISKITVTNCTVENRNWDNEWTYYNQVSNSSYHTGSGAWSMGGLIGESRMKNNTNGTPGTDTGTLCIGADGAANKIVLDNVTVTGYGYIAGVLGKAGNAVLTGLTGTLTAANYHGGVSIKNVEVKNSTINAGTGENAGGCCAGIMAAEICKIGGVSIEDCTVSDTTITSNNNLGTIGNNYTECAGIAAHMSGTVKDCTVEDCTITSCTPGGIVARSSRKSTTSYDGTTPVPSDVTLLTIDGCTVKGETEITQTESSSVNEAGGILSAARNANAVITGCTVGSSVHIHGDFFYAGGFVGYATGAYTVSIRDSVMLATVENLEGLSVDSVIAGGVAYAGLNSDCLKIDRCVIGGEINNDTYYCGGVIGQYIQNGACTNLVTNCTIISKLQATTAPITKTADRAARIMAYYSSTSFATGGTNWMGTATVGSVFVLNIVSSYPETLEDMPCFGARKTSGGFDTMYTSASLNSAYLVSQECIEDVNRPNADGQNSRPAYTTTSGGVTTVTAKYMHNSASPYSIDNTNYATISVDNRITIDDRLEFYEPADDATICRYAGWISTSNGDLEVLAEDSNSNATTATSVKLLAKKSATDIGVKGAYSIVASGTSGSYTYVVDPDTSARVLIEVMMPVTCTRIPSLIQLTGKGTLADPWQIKTLDDLETLRSLDLDVQTETVEVNGVQTTIDKKYYMLMNDITVNPSVFENNGDFYNNGEWFKPIVGQNTGGAFKCVLLGCGHTISGLKMNSSSASTGLFASTDGATIRDLTLANATIFGSGASVGGLVGTANNTTFENITISGTTITASHASGSASVYAGALAAYVTDSSAGGTTLSDVTITNAYFTGGLYGHAHYTSGNTNEIHGTKIEGLTVTSKALTAATQYDGTHSGKLDAAGGIAAEFAGEISGSYSAAAATYSYVDYTDASNPTAASQSVAAVSITGTTIGALASPAKNVAVTGSNASAVVGFIDQTLTSGVTCNISNVTIGGATGTVSVSSATDSANAAAGGVVGKIRMTDNDNGTGVPNVDLTVNNCVLRDNVTVSAVHYAGGVLGNSGMAVSAGSVEITNCTSFASVNASNASSAAGAIAGRIFTVKDVFIDKCVASGTLSAQTYVGGVIGLSDDTATTIVTSDYSTNGGILKNIVFSAQIAPPSGSNPTEGVLFGSVATLALPNDYTTSPFVNIYYSSYGLYEGLAVQYTVTVDGVQKDVDSFKLAGNEVYAGYRATFIDLMENFAHHYVENNTDMYDTQLVVTRNNGNGLVLGASDIRLACSIVTENGVTTTTPYCTGTFWSFTCTDSVPFELESVYSKNRDNRLNYAFTRSGETINGVRLTVRNDGMGDAVFHYANGINLALDLIASDIPGHGTSNDPYLIERISHLDAIRTFPNKVFYLAADLDFSPTATQTAYGQPLTDDEKAWASNWADWANSLSTATKQFTGTLVGAYYPYSGTYPNGSYNTSATPVTHTIKNLTVNTDMTYTPLVENPDYDSSDPTSQEYISGTAVDYSSTIKGVGLFPVLPESATVTNLKFAGCSFSTAVANMNVGVLAGESYGTVSDIEVDNGTYSNPANPVQSEVTAVGAAASGTKHVGGIVGLCFTKYENNNPVKLSNCTVKNATITSTHCAGGIVGGGANVLNGNVTNVTVTGREQAGGIAGGTLSFNSDPTEVPNDDRDHMKTATFENCEVSACTIQSTNTVAVISSVGGILGVAEPGYDDDEATVGNTNEKYRSITFDHCTVDSDTKVKALALMGVETNQQNYAGGILGQLQTYYDGFVIENCASYASVYAYGKKTPSATYPSAGALVGCLRTANQLHRLNVSGTQTFRLINNVCSGKVCSTVYAGGVWGYFGANPAAGYVAPSNAKFACGNIISASYETIEDSSGASVDSSKFGVFMGYCANTAFASGAAESTMTDNYYSSDVCAIGGTPIARFGSGSPVSACAELFDVAARSAVDALSVTSSLMVQNWQYMEDPDTHDYVPVLKTDELSGSAIYEDTVYAPYVEIRDSITDEVTGVVYPGSTGGNDTLNLPLQFQYNTSMTNGTVSLSSDFGSTSTTKDVYTTGMQAADVHTLRLNSIYIDPTNSSYYGASKVVQGSQNLAAFQVKDNPENCYTEHALVADLGYGLLVKIVVQTKSGAGTFEDPYIIPDEETFAHYFFGDFARDDTRQYNYKYYKQTNDLDFDKILKVINKEAPYDTSTETFNTPFTPIGVETNAGAFYGGYNGAGHRIYNFHYEQPMVSDNYAIKNVGLFGYVADISGQTNYHLKNLHIELKDTPLDSDNMTGTNLASVCGGVNTGGLVGKYNSSIAIDNCSVVYGTVRSGEYRSGVIDTTNGETVNVGGLVGWMNGTAMLVNCFTSTNVRAGENYADNSGDTNTNYTCGGLVGLRTSGNTSNVQLTCTFQNCFCSSDVVGPYFVGGFLGKTQATTTKIQLTNCASTATVTGLSQIESGIYGASLVVGYSPASSGIASYQNNVPYVQANNVLIAGMNTTEYSVVGTNLADQFYPMLFGTATIYGESGGIFYDASVIGRVTVPNGTAQPNLLRTTNVLCNGSGNAISGSAPFTAMKTDDLLQTNFNGLGSAWNASDGVLYPYLKMSSTDGDSADADTYFTAFSKLSALPMKADDREADDEKVDRVYAGVTYPTTVSKTLGAAGPSLTIESSKFSAWSEDSNGYTGAQANYDYLLSGNESGGNDRADMKTDLLFNRGSDSTNTQDYGRTDDLTDYQILRNTYLTKSYTYSDNGTDRDYFFTRNERSPYVRVTGTVEGRTIHRCIHVGLRGSAATSYVATERQLRAISSLEANNTKFYYAYKDTIVYDTSHSKNIRLCADISFNPKASVRTQSYSFTPITGYKATQTGDEFEGAFGFDGSNCEIRNLFVVGVNNAGLFGPITSDAPMISNLILRNPEVSGSTYVGALVSNITTTQATKINNCMVIGGKVGISAGGGAHSMVGGLVGALSNENSASRVIEQIGVVGVQISNASTSAAESAGLVFGSIADTTITNVYAIGELTVNATSVGMLAGDCSDCQVNRVVTSGYVDNPNSSGYVGGIFGEMKYNGSATALKNAESTAFVSGSNVVGGIVAEATGQNSNLHHVLIDRVIFAGSIGGTASTTSYILGSSTYTDVTNVCYNQDMRLTGSESTYNPLTTLQIVRGTGTPGKSVMSDGYTLVSDSGDADYGKYRYDALTDGGSFVYDTSGRYYPNPVSLVSKKAQYATDVEHVVTDAYKTGLSFALARINLAYAGTGGTVTQYDQITVTSPMSINVFSSVIDNTKQSNDDEGVKRQALDKVTLTEYNTNNTALGSSNNGSTAYLVSNGSYLTPNSWKPNVKTGVRATLDTSSTGTDSVTGKPIEATFKGVENLYRFLIVNVVRVVKIDYVIDDPNSLLGSANDKAVLMLRTDDNGVKYSSSAVTSKFQDSDTSNGETYTVKYRNILATDSYIYVDAMLPSGCKIASYALSSQSPYEGTWDGTYNRIRIDTAPQSATDPLTVQVKLTATITSDPSWGIRDMTGGIG